MYNLQFKKIRFFLIKPVILFSILNTQYSILHCFSQQVPQYSQYLFNNYGLNPAYASKNNCLEVVVGKRYQWVGFPNAPTTTFLGMNKVFGKKPFRNGWHAMGFYLEEDQMNLVKSDALYPSYSYHLRLTPNYYGSFGVFAGMKLLGVNPAVQDPNDPAFKSLSSNVLVVPDIAVGMRFYSKQNFFDLAVRQIYKSDIKLGTKEIGTPSKLKPHINFIAGRRIESNAYYYTYVPSINIRYTLLVPPSVDLTFMMFVKKMIGFGLSYRFNDAMVGMVQYKFRNIITIGFAYDYTLSKMRLASSNTREIMLGFTSCPPGADVQRTSGCPAYDH